MSGPPKLGDTGDPWTCPACGSPIKTNPGGTRVIRTVVAVFVLHPDGTEKPDPYEKRRIQYYHRPCWAAAVNRFNAQQAEGFRTGDHA